MRYLGEREIRQYWLDAECPSVEDTVAQLAHCIEMIGESETINFKTRVAKDSALAFDELTGVLLAAETLLKRRGEL